MNIHLYIYIYTYVYGPGLCGPPGPLWAPVPGIAPLATKQCICISIFIYTYIYVYVAASKTTPFAP